jgi:HEPN domain-containing protein
MRPITQEWIKKAEGNWVSGQRMYRTCSGTDYSSACFQMYETADKYLKACLAEAEVSFERELELKKTVRLAFKIESVWKAVQPELTLLANYTLDYLYPGRHATKPEAQEAIKSCRKVRKAIRSAFGLPV